MEFMLALVLAIAAAMIAFVYIVLAVIGMLLPIIFWVLMIWLVIKLFKKYT